MENFLKLSPYIAWMVLMMAGLPYWLRTVCSGLLLFPLAWRLRESFKVDVPGIVAGVFAGLAVFLIWIAPETFGWVGTPEKPAVPYPYIQLVGSAFVIATAEELFFRDWLYNWLATSWSRKSAALLMLALFAVEHDKYICALVAGAVYFALYLRRGLASAIAAHVVTNFALGVYVILTNRWYFW